MLDRRGRWNADLVQNIILLCSFFTHFRFAAHSLPEDDGEFYQFCYVGEGQVRGASVPFQFKSPRGEDFVEVEGDEDLMIVRTKTAVLQVRHFPILNS